MPQHYQKYTRHVQNKMKQIEKKMNDFVSLYNASHYFAKVSAVLYLDPQENDVWLADGGCVKQWHQKQGNKRKRMS